MKNILAAVDFSDVTAGVLKNARHLGRMENANVWILHVAAPDPDFIGYEPGPQTVRNSRAEQLQKEHRELQAMAEQCARENVAAEALLIQAPTVDGLLQEAARLNIELIIMGSHGHGAIHKALTGSVCEGILRKANCPVLVVPARHYAL